jgi:hypothetical protein
MQSVTSLDARLPTLAPLLPVPAGPLGRIESWLTAVVLIGSAALASALFAIPAVIV